MKSSKELFERLQKDEEFAKQFADLVQSKRDSGAKNYYETLIPAASELGYELTMETVDEFLQQNYGEISEEELGKVAGGSPIIVTLLGAISIGATGGLAYITIKETSKED